MRNLLGMWDTKARPCDKLNSEGDDREYWETRLILNSRYPYWYHRKWLSPFETGGVSIFDNHRPFVNLTLH